MFVVNWLGYVCLQAHIQLYFKLIQCSNLKVDVLVILGLHVVLGTTFLDGLNEFVFLLSIITDEMRFLGGNLILNKL